MTDETNDALRVMFDPVLVRKDVLEARYVMVEQHLVRDFVPLWLRFANLPKRALDIARIDWWGEPGRTTYHRTVRDVRVACNLYWSGARQDAEALSEDEYVIWDAVRNLAITMVWDRTGARSLYDVLPGRPRRDLTELLSLASDAAWYEGWQAVKAFAAQHGSLLTAQEIAEMKGESERNTAMVDRAVDLAREVLLQPVDQCRHLDMSLRSALADQHMLGWVDRGGGRMSIGPIDVQLSPWQVYVMSEGGFLPGDPQQQDRLETYMKSTAFRRAIAGTSLLRRARLAEEATCIVCGCTDSRACIDGGQPCSWAILNVELQLGVCSACMD